MYNGQTFTPEGLVIKTFPLNVLITQGVEPSLSEMEKLELGSNESMNLKYTAGKSSVSKFAVEDKVCVIAGELENLQGKIVKIHENIISVLPSHKDLTVIQNLHIFKGVSKILNRDF